MSIGWVGFLYLCNVALIWDLGPNDVYICFVVGVINKRPDKVSIKKKDNFFIGHVKRLTDFF